MTQISLSNSSSKRISILIEEKGGCQIRQDFAGFFLKTRTTQSPERICKNVFAYGSLINPLEGLFIFFSFFRCSIYFYIGFQFLVKDSSDKKYKIYL